MALMVVLLAVLGSRLEFGWPWFAGLAIAAGLFVYQLWLARDREREGCFRAFLNNNWVGLVIFLGLAGQYFIAGSLGLG